MSSFVNAASGDRGQDSGTTPARLGRADRRRAPEPYVAPHREALQAGFENLESQLPEQRRILRENSTYAVSAWTWRPRNSQASVIHAEAEPTFRTGGERGDIVRSMHRAMSGWRHALALLPTGADKCDRGASHRQGAGRRTYDKGYPVMNRADGRPTCRHVRNQSVMAASGAWIRVPATPACKIAMRST
jgi:hypothetical protein